MKTKNIYKILGLASMITACSNSGDKIKSRMFSKFSSKEKVDQKTEKSPTERAQELIRYYENKDQYIVSGFVRENLGYRHHDIYPLIISFYIININYQDDLDYYASHYDRGPMLLDCNSECFKQIKERTEDSLLYPSNLLGALKKEAREETIYLNIVSSYLYLMETEPRFCNSKFCNDLGLVFFQKIDLYIFMKLLKSKGIDSKITGYAYWMQYDYLVSLISLCAKSLSVDALKKMYGILIEDQEIIDGNKYLIDLFLSGIKKRKDLKEIIDFYPSDEQETEAYFNNRLNKMISNKNIGSVKSCIIL